MTPFISLTRVRGGTPVSVNVMTISYLVPLSNGTQVQFGEHGLLVKESTDDVETAISEAFGNRRGFPDVDIDDPADDKTKGKTPRSGVKAPTA